MKFVTAMAVLGLLGACCGLGLTATAAPAKPALQAKPAIAAAPVAASDPLSPESNNAFLAAYAQKKGVIVKPDGLMFHILRNGFGKRPQPTDTVEVYYTGKMINGVMFDGTSPGLPAFFKVTDVLPGWIEALENMREGDHWEIVLPPKIAYGSRGMGEVIPPNQTLIFDMALIQTIPLPKRGEKGYVPDPNDPDDKQQ